MEKTTTSLPSGYSLSGGPDFFRTYRGARWGKQPNSTLSPVAERAPANSLSVVKKSEGPVIGADPRVDFQPSTSVQATSNNDSQQGASEPLPELSKYPWAVPLSSLSADVARGSGANTVEEGKASRASFAR